MNTRYVAERTPSNVWDIRGRNFSSATALTHVREQILDILVSGIMSNAGNESSGEQR